MRNRIFILVGVAAAAVVALAAQQVSTPPPPMSDSVAGYHLSASIPLPDEGFWDYLGIDEVNHHLFVSHSDEILVISTKTNRIVGKLGPTPRTHGVVISQKDNHGFTSNSGNSSGQQGVSSFTEFDPKTLTIIKQVILPIGGSDGIVYDPASDRVFGLTHGKKDVAVDAATGKVAGVIEIPGAAESAAADGKGHLYNVMEDLSTIVEIDTHALKVVNQWPLAPCEGPSGVAMDTKTRRIFIGCHGGGGGDNNSGVMVVFNPDEGKVIATLPIGGKGNDAVRFDPAATLAFASEGEGDITIVHEDAPDKFTVLGNVKTEQGARTMECDTTTHTLYSVTAKFGPLPPPEPNAPPARFRRGPMIPGSFTLLVIPNH